MKAITATVLLLLALALTKAEPPSPYTTTYEDVFVPPPPPSFDSSGATFSGSLGNRYQRGRAVGQTTAAIFSPSSSYGAPPSGYGTPSSGYGAPPSGYGASPSGSGYQDDHSEPANYEFSYTVEDAPSGNDFGHRESRQEDTAWGSYFVLLPDGRKQIVEYTADRNGYKPTIRYEDTGRGSAGPRGYSY